MSSTKHQFISGVAYMAIAKYAGMVIQLGITMVLSRILAPEMFGILLPCTVLINFFALFSDMGLGPAVIQHKNLGREDLDNLFSFTCWMALVLSVLFFFFAPLIALYYENPLLTPICRWLSINLLFSSLNVIPNGLIFRDKKFRFMTIRTLSLQLGTGLMAILAAYYLPGEKKIYALVLQSVVSTAGLFVFNYLEYPLRFRFTLGLSTLRTVFGYSAYQGLFSVINYLSRNFDKLLISKIMGMEQAGFYEKSYRTMLLPLQNITSVLAPVMHPVFSDMRDNLKGMLHEYLKIVRLLSFIGFPLSVLLFFSGTEIILLLFGDQWGPSIPAFRILALSVGIQMVLSSSGSIFQAAGDTRTLFISGLISTAVNVAGMLVSMLVFRTMEALAWGIVITFGLNFLLCYIMMYRITFKLDMNYFWKQFISPSILSLILAAALWALYRLLPADMNMFLSLGIKCAATALIWFPYVQLSGVFDILSYLKKFRR